MIAAVVLAAGASRRMGEFKLLLPLGPYRVIAWVVRALMAADLDKIVVVTGHRRDEVEAALAGYPVRCVHNPDYAAGEMLSSIQVGLRALGDTVDAALLVLGDQPRLQSDVVRSVMEACWRKPQPSPSSNPARRVRPRGFPLPLPELGEGGGKGVGEGQRRSIIIPTYAGRRGHPICLPCAFWSEVLALPWSDSMRDLLRERMSDIMEVPVQTDTILRDMDTREDYEGEVRLLEARNDADANHLS